MPQFDFSTWPGQIAWLLIVFAGLYFVLARVFLPRMSTTMQARQNKISGDMEEARRLRDEAQAQSESVDAQLAEARIRAQRTAADAKAQSVSEASQRQAALEAELAGRLSQAEARIRASRDQAMEQVKGIATDTAAAMTERLSGRAASSAELDRAYDTISAPDIGGAE